MSSSTKPRGRGAFRGKFNAQRQQEPDKTQVHAHLLKQARKTGHLNLSGRSLSIVPESVWKVNIELPEEARSTLMEGGDDTWWEQVDLTKLILASNLLTEIPDDIRQLPALTVLDVRDNRLERISDAIGELLELQRLVLRSNLSQMQSLQQMSFTNMTICLQHYLHHNMLTSLPSVIGNLTKLGTLHLDNNQLTELCDDLGSLISLQDLNVSKNHLTALPPAIDWLRMVSTLNVSQNHLTELPHEIGSLLCLRVLDASQNKLTSLPDSLENLSKLELLYLQQNRLSAIPRLTHCAVLKDVQLGDNCLTEVRPDHLKTFASVSILDLRDNKISSIPDEVAMLQSLERLTLSNNNLSGLPYVLGTLSNLKTLQLEGNPMRSIRRDIIARGTDELKKYLRSRMPATVTQQESSQNGPKGVNAVQEGYELNQHEVHQLKSFDYSGKQAAAVPESVWTEVAKGSVTTINLSKNKLTDLPAELMVVSDTLKDLQIGYNKIENLTPDIGLYVHLSCLDLRNNCLTRLPEEMSSLKNLREIVLSCNRFQELPPVLWKLSKLEVLFANDNKIVSINVDGILQLKQLGTLDLQNNDIATVPPTLGNVTWLKSLHLSGNAFRNPRPAILTKGTVAVLEYLRDKIV